MDNKADVKAMLARFQAGGSSIDETSSAPVGRPKQPLQLTVSGPGMQRKPFSETLSGSALPSKPSVLKNTPSTKSDTDTPEPNKIKAMANRFANSPDDANSPSKPVGNKLQSNLKPAFPQAEAKAAPHAPLFNKPSINSTQSEAKPAFPKPPAGFNSKPSWVKEDSGGGTTPNPSPAPQQKPISNVRKMWQQSEEQTDANTETANKSPLQANAAAKSPSNFRTAQTMFNKDKDTAEQPESGVANKRPFAVPNANPPPKPPTNKKPSIKKPPKVSPLANGINGDSASGPKRNPLPNSLALGPPPAKPNRPPKVDLESFRRGAETSENGPSFKKPTFSAPSPAHASNQKEHVTQTTPPPPALPNLPPRNMIQDDVYDDVDQVAPPPLPAAHPSHKTSKDEIDDDDDDGETYEDLDERWEEAEKSQEKKDKEDKKRLEAAKKEQKERERKEQDARKKFKVGKRD